jgi:hypothetical protein
MRYSLQFYPGIIQNFYDPLGKVSDTYGKFNVMLFGIEYLLDRASL